MTAEEWFDIIKKAKDYNHEFTPLIKKYGELCVKDYKENECACIYEYNDDHRPLLVYECTNCLKIKLTTQ